MAFSSLHLLYLIAFLAATRHCLADKNDATVSANDDDQTCKDKSSCLGIELEQWFTQLNEKKAQFDCTVDDAKVAAGTKTEPLYALADCNSPNAIWQYKYGGAKGKKRMPNGKGKISFSKMSNPPHGYDYGMKSGICFTFGVPSDQLTVKSVEGVFDNGIPNGEAEVTYFDKTSSKGMLKMGIPHGFIRRYELLMDKETNLEKTEKTLTSIAVYANGVQFGHEWTIREDGIKLLRTVGKEESTLAVVPVGNDTKYLVGTIDEDDMMVGVRYAKIASLEDKNCLKVVEVEEFGEKFDYDLQVKSKIKKTVAKLVRFFEIAADSTAVLEKHFGANKEPVAADALKLLHIVRKEKTHYVVKTPQGETRIRFDGGTKDQKEREKNPLPTGTGQITFLSDIRRKEMFAASEESSAEPEESTLDGEKSAKELEDFMNEYVALDMLPFRFKESKRMKSINGRFENGLLQGYVRVTHLDNSVLEGFCVDGALHGVVREIDTPLTKGKRKRYVSRLVENVLLGGGLLTKDEAIAEVLFLGVYKNGYIDGPGWKFNVGGTFLFGQFQKTTTFTTNQGAYINQDLESAYVGRFIDGKMMAGQIGSVTGQRTEAGIRVPEFSDLEEQVFRYVVPEAGKMIDPLVTDVTEDIWVEVKKSREPGDSGEGLFAKDDIPDNTVFAYFGGERLSWPDWNATKPFDPEYWIKVEDTNEIIHLPDAYGRDTSKYRATLGHKINHSFNKWNCLFHNLDHPRFGLIPAARTTESVAAGDELLCNYQQEYDQASPWFQELYRQQIDRDFVFGPFGHRGNKTEEAGQAIRPMLTNSTLYKEFYKHAVEVLKLDPNAL